MLKRITKAVLLSLFLSLLSLPHNASASAPPYFALRNSGGAVISGLVGYWDFSDKNFIGKNRVNGSVLDLHNIDTNVVKVMLPNATHESATALNLHGNDYLEGLVSDLPVNNSAYTIGGWVYLDKASSNGIMGWGSYGYSGQVNALRSDWDGNGFVNYSWGRDSTYNTRAYLGGQWVYVISTYDGLGTASGQTGHRKIYINGVNVFTDNIDQLSVNQADSKITIGVTNHTEYFQGKIANLAIFNRALNSSEITDLYSGNYSQDNSGNRCYLPHSIQNRSFEDIPSDQYWSDYGGPKQIGRVPMNYPNWCWQTTTFYQYDGDFNHNVEIQRLVSPLNDSTNASLGDTLTAINLINETNSAGDYINQATAVPVDGNYFAEINAEAPAMLYQDIVTTPGDVLRWRISHKGRQTTMEGMHVEIGAVDSVTGNTSLNYSSQKIQDSRDQVGNPPSNFAESPYSHRVPGFQGSWDSVSGSIQENQTVTLVGVQRNGGSIITKTPYAPGSLNPDYWGIYSGTYTVPAGQTLTRFAFVSDAASPSIGNLLDNIIFAKVQSISWSQPTSLSATLESTTITPASITGDGTLQYSIFDSGTSHCTLNAMVLSWSSAGTCIIQAYAEPTSNFSDAVSRLTLTLTHSVTFNPNNGSGSMSAQISEKSTALSLNTFSRDHFSFSGWNTSANGTGTSYSDQASFPFTTDTILYAQWSSAPPPPPPASPPAMQFPGVVWNPKDLVEGSPLTSANQLNAEFSVLGLISYSLAPGSVFKPGPVTITVTFWPTDTEHYFAISTSRTIQVIALPTPTPTPTPSSSAAPSDSATPPKPQSIKNTSLTLIGSIYFNNNEYFLDATDIATIKSAAATLKSIKHGQVMVEGNTDVKLGVDNVWLSQSRATAVADALQKNIKVPQLIRAWYASTRPIAIGLDKASLAKNRRVDIYALTENSKPAPTTSPAATSKPSLQFTPITFNRNEYFLSAIARQELISDTQNLFESGCQQVSLVGTQDATHGGLPNLGLLRASAVRDYIKRLDPQLQFAPLKMKTSSVREVLITCAR
jgi:outer membrane protein OmpA-like peptidoglycan-associated protein